MWVIKIKALDLFCGIGGLSIGLNRAGIEVVAGVDKWEDAGETFQANQLDEKFVCADLSEMATDKLLVEIGINPEDIDLIAGGPPCQGFSTVGKRDQKDPRNSHWINFMRVVEDIRPSYVLIENVEGLNVMGGGAVKRGIIEGFNSIGYKMKSQLLRAADFGVPQLRKRVFFFGWLPNVNEPEFPVPTCAKHITVAEAIFDLPELGPGEIADGYSRPASSDYQKIMRGNCPTLNNHQAANHPEHLVEKLSYIPDGGNRKSIPDHLQPKSGFHNSYARLASYKPAIAVTSNMRKPSSARSTHPTQNRGLTVREGLRLQSFPDNFIVLGSRTSQYLQVGNAVPPLLGKAIGGAILEAFKNTNKETIIKARNEWAPVMEPAEIPLQLVLTI